MSDDILQTLQPLYGRSLIGYLPSRMPYDSIPTGIPQMLQSIYGKLGICHTRMYKCINSMNEPNQSSSQLKTHATTFFFQYQSQLNFIQDQAHEATLPLPLLLSPPRPFHRFLASPRLRSYRLSVWVMATVALE